MGKATHKPEKYLLILAGIIILFALMNCSDDQPIIIREDDGSIVGIVKPEGVVALVKVFQGVLIDSTFTDSTTGYFEIENLSPGSYEIEIIATGYGTYTQTGVEIRGITSVGEILLRQIPGQIKAFIPSRGAKNVSLTAPCGIVFNTPMEHNSIENNFDISPNIQGYFQWEDTETTSTLYFYPTSRYRAHTTYTFSLTTGARTISGDSLAFAVSSNFVTEPVQILSSNPENGATYINPGTSIYFRFNTAMERTSVENAFSLEPNVDGYFIWHNNESFSYYLHSKLATSTFYFADISTNAKDIYGTSIIDIFSIEFAVEPLAIQYNYPQNGSTAIPRNTSIQIAFNTDVNQNLAESAFAISPSVAGSFSWSDLSRFTFTPEQNLQANRNYTVIITTTCTDISGVPLPDNFQFTFTTSL